MKLRSLLLSLLGALLFLAGVLVGFLLSAVVVWGESEARIYTSYNGESASKYNARSCSHQWNQE